MITLACCMTPIQEKHTQRKLRTASVSTVISISLVLFMLGILGLTLINAQRLSNYVKENVGFTIMLKDETKAVDVFQFQKTLDASDWAKRTEYTSKEQAALMLQEELGEDFIQFLGFNPLSAAIDVQLLADFATSEQMKLLAKELEANLLVKEVIFQEELVDAINKNVRKMGILVAGFCGLLLLIAIALINNTIRLAVYAKRFVIRTMKLVGATHGFIRKPFLYSGFIQGLFGALIGILLLIATLYGVQQEMPELLVLQDLPTVGVIFAGMLLLGILMNLLATNIAVGKYLRMNEDDLYR